MVPFSFPVANTILGAGSQSLLRTEKDLWKSYKVLRDITPRNNGNIPLEPIHVRGPPNLTLTVVSREVTGGVSLKHILTNKFYSRFHLFSRTIGHLSAVYCMLFDQSGRYIITGADDNLVKIWCVLDGRLLGTLRGASAEISDIAIDSENTMVAAGSCDKIIRVWSLQTMAPIAVLTGHTGMVTAVQFCPAPDNEGVLVSTGGDGCVAFWTFTHRGNDIRFDPKPLKLNERVRPGNAQLICASFSSGGNFLAVGGADHFVRVYRLGGGDGIEKLLEVETHQDRVDSIQFCHQGLRFATGSRDGSAIIWKYQRQQWKTTILSMSETLPGFSNTSEDSKRPQVTMVGWDHRDLHVITASSDKLLRVWDSTIGQLCHILKGHEDNAYVIEAHPTDSRLILTAGHDGQLFIWDVLSGVSVRSFKNTIEGQGHGALFDAKWSPDGFTIAATDSHGHLSIFGIGHNDLFKKIPQELFFHTDYRPLVRDGNHHVLDEQTQMAPHLMPPPFLVNMDGNPYPPELQRLVPGRESCRHDQLIPNVIFGANGEQEVLDLGVADIAAENAAAVAAEALESAQNGSEAGAGENTSRPNIDDMIQRLAQEQDQRLSSTRRASQAGDQAGPSGLQQQVDATENASGERRSSTGGLAGDHSYAAASGHDPLSPRTGRVGARRVGDVEGVRQSRGNWQRDPHMKWNRRVIVKPLSSAQFEHSVEMRHSFGQLEMEMYEEEYTKKPEALMRSPQLLPNDDKDTLERRTRRKQKKQTHSYSTRSTRERRKVQAREDYEDPDLVIPSHDSSSSEAASESEVENEELEESSSSDEQSTDYSDWTADAGVNLEPPKRTAHKQKKSAPKKKRKGEVSDKEDEEESGNGDVGMKRRRSKKKEPEEEGETRQRQGRRKERINMAEGDSGVVGEIPEEFRPPEWLSETYAKKAPYFPQMGDELMYFMQGHMLYVEAVMNRNLYTVDKRSLPWMRPNKLRDQEYVKIIGIKYEIKPPRLCCLKLGIMDPGSNRLTGDSFTIKYHDIPDVLDFLILKQTFDTAVMRQWKRGDRFRCIIDDAWWFGAMEAHSPHLTEFPDSMFMCYRVMWDNGEAERLSPWDMEVIDDNMEPRERGGSVRIQQRELDELLYKPSCKEWAGREPEQQCDRIARGIGIIMGFAVAEPFLAPVDLNAYPEYAMMIAYSVDLSTIKSRLENGFYRRIAAVQFDVRYIATNTEKFNQRGSNIVRQARIVTDLCLQLIKDGDCEDPTSYYHGIQASYQSPHHSDADGHESGSERSRKEAVGGPTTSSMVTRKRRAAKSADGRPWQIKCKDLLKSMFEREDSMPFRHPVDQTRYPDYNQVVDVPMDLSTIREELSIGGYSTPHEFAKDVRLLFSNSKSYNTNQKSRIYSMTVRLEAYFEDQIKSVLSQHKGEGKQLRTKGPYRRGQRVQARASNKLSEPPATRSQQPLLKVKLNIPVAAGTRSSVTQPSRSYRNETPSALHKSNKVPGKPVHTRSRRDPSCLRIRGSRGAHSQSHDDLSEDDKGMRRSKRVARLKRLQGSDEGPDSGEEYSPVKKKMFPSTSISSSKKNTRNRGKATVRYQEVSDCENEEKAHKTSARKKILSSTSESDESDVEKEQSVGTATDSSVEQTGSVVLRRSKRRMGTSSDSEKAAVGVKRVRKVNGVIKKDMTNSDSGDSESDDILRKTKNMRSGRLKDRLQRRRLESDRESESPKSVKNKIKSPNIKKTRSTSKMRKGMKEESEVEFDENELEDSEEYTEEETPPKRGRKKGVASNVRRAKKVILDGDDEDDRDFIVDDDFIDDEDASESESSSESEEDSADSERPRKKRKKRKKQKKALSKKQRVGKVKKKKTGVKKKIKKPPVRGRKQRFKTAASLKYGRRTSRNVSVSYNKTIKSPQPKLRPKKCETLVTSTDQNNFPYRPLDIDPSTHIIREVKHRGQVIGRVITAKYHGQDHYDEVGNSFDYSSFEESMLSDSDSESVGVNIPSGTKASTSRGLNAATKRLNGSDGESQIRKSSRSQKRIRYGEEEEEDEVDDDDDDDIEMNVSSRGRVRRANTLMRDFI